MNSIINKKVGMAEEGMGGGGMPQPKKKGGWKGKIVLFIVLLIILGAGGYAYYALYYNTEAQKTARAEQQVVELTNKVSRLMILPEEKPIALRIDDPNLLVSQQPFFTNSQKGDYLLIFLQNAKAVIYSPSRNIIVNTGPVTQEPGAENQVPQEAPAETETGEEVTQ